MPHRIEVGSTVPDTRAQVRKNKFGERIADVQVIDVYTVDKEFSGDDLNKIAEALSNPVLQAYAVDKAFEVADFDWAIETGFLPGVTDNIGTTSREIIQDLLGVKFEDREAVYSSQVTYVKGDISREEASDLGESMANPLIQKITVKSREEWDRDGGMDVQIPIVNLKHEPSITEVDLNISDEELTKLGKEGIANEDGSRRGPLALSLDYMRAIRDHFKELGRNPTDVELEALAQTWSEHCKHTIFASCMDDIKDGIYKHYIKRATNDIRAAKGDRDFCVSVFKDNSGGIVLDEDWIVTHKAETHNSPSALDPFGGAITGIVGVNRDTVGFGLGAKPIVNMYGYCFADPRDEKPLYKGDLPMLSPRRILEGVVEGVNVGGNCSGIPTPQGFMYFDDRYKGKPLVFVGTVGLIPSEVGGKPSWKKKAQVGDKVVVVGGRVGQDGIHGATFSSEVMDSGSPSAAVQIGDPITQKKFSDAIVKEARDLGLYNSITDNGAGGISCSVAEMAEECGGCYVDLDKVPLKYPGLDPWQIWISESQERMTLSVPEEKLVQFEELMRRRGVETTVIGEFTDSGKCEVKYKGEMAMELDLSFLHDGLPEKCLKTTYTKVAHDEPDNACPADLTDVMHDMISRLNTCSFDFVSHQYDHVILGGHCIGPLQGKGRVNNRTSVVMPVLGSYKGVAMSQALNPKYSDIDTYHMAACAIDTAIRNIISVGGTLDHLALLDNFCWCSSDEEERLGQLKDAARACYDYATAYGTPYISGKDSMFNDFKGRDHEGNQVRISVPPTLLISSIGVIDDVRECVTMEPKVAGDLIYILGETFDELGGSEYFDYLGFVGNKVPEVNVDKAISLYKAVERAHGLLASCESIGIGGLGVSLMRMAIASDLGMGIVLNSDVRADFLLFSESQSRFVVTVDPKKKAEFEAAMEGLPFGLIGKVREDKKFTIEKPEGEVIVDSDVSKLNDFYRKTFDKY
ncbi:MAG: AIR synthase-related protein [Patescibacteria group bacterium]|nr:phosphoribosylformylglycinamidine synthase [Patescibacteria group bacterium]